jgi:hypothetical protein
VQQLLAFSSKDVVRPQVLSLNDAIESRLEMLQGIIGGDIAITTKLDPALSFTRIGHSQIEQIIVNLAVNASTTMPEGGTLLFSTRNHVESGTGPSGVPPGNYVEVDVTDSGEGIDPRSCLICSNPSLQPGRAVRGPDWVSRACTASWSRPVDLSRPPASWGPERLFGCFCRPPMRTPSPQRRRPDI